MFCRELLRLRTKYFLFQDMVSSGGRLNLAPDFDICDSEEQSALEHALLTAQYRLAESILEAGASIDLEDSQGCSLMLKTIKRKDVPCALFLIEHGADINVRCVLKIYWKFGFLVCVGGLIKPTIAYLTIPYHTYPYHTLPYHTLPYHTLP